MQEEPVDNLLRALRESDSGREAPARVEVCLREAFRQRHRRAFPWGLQGVRGRLAAAAVAVLAILVFRVVGLRPAEHARQDTPPVLQTEAPAAAEAYRRPVPDARSAPAVGFAAVPVKTAVSRTSVRPERVTEEVVTEFFPLMEGAPPLEQGSIVRMSVPLSTMRRVGLPVREDRMEQPIQADVVFGQEGLARAIRFVSYR